MNHRRKSAHKAPEAPTVLVIGRVRARVAMIQRALERYGILTTTFAWRAPASGLWRRGAKAPHAIVVDVPSAVTADYVETLQRLRDRWELVPQIVVTSAAGPSVLTSLLAVGVDDFVSSDRAWAELVVRLRRQLRRASPLILPMPAGPEGMQLDGTRRTVGANGRRVTLTTREFAVFRCLADGGGTTLSRAEILLRVWGDGDDRPSSTGIVGVYVLYLRRKLSKVGLAHALRTVKGEGYSFQAPGDYWAPAQPSAATPGGAGRTRAGDLHPSTALGARGARDDHVDIAPEAKQDAKQAVRREALKMP
ncbi:MAG TPA: winged helix-turn-helix domain-containing protein [Gemmatimonadaceae bacterium]|nr:winged helix-turn-helix domain-containing protein [Gemmatimonadaceae bacterium]